MGDTACLVHSLSYACGLSNEPKQGNPTPALGESVSFGRFMSDSLAWEKWSTFSHNRYVEEAERYAQPGSVAQKKAFFEAHYKRIAAAKKAAAFLEQATSATNTAQEPAGAASAFSQAITFDPHTAAAQQPEVNKEFNVRSFEPEGTRLGAIQVEYHHSPNTTPASELIGGTPKMEKPKLYVAVPPAPVNVPPTREASNSTKTFDNGDDTSASDHSGTPQMEKPLLKIISCNEDASSAKIKKKSAFSAFKSSIYPKTSKVSSSPAKMVTPRIRREHNPAPLTNKSTLKFTEIKPSQKALTTYINSAPAKTPDRSLPPSNAKTPSTRVGSAAYKAFQACVSPLRTPNTVASARMSKSVSATPQPESTRRFKSPRDGSKTAVPKWNILSAVCSKPLTAPHSKLQPQTVSTPFTLRTEERAARRKQKLEEEFNLNETPKVQLQTKIKEKAELELRKLRQSFCFKARPLPDFYKVRETAEKQSKKGTTAEPQPFKLGRKSSSNRISQPSCASTNKNSKQGNRSPTASHFLASTNHENKSPNIQF